MTDLTAEEQKVVSDLMELAPKELTADELQEVASVLRVLPSSLRFHGSGDTPTAQRTYWFEVDRPGLKATAGNEGLAFVDRDANDSTTLVRVLAQQEVLFHVPLELGERLCKLGCAPG